MIDALLDLSFSQRVALLTLANQVINADVVRDREEVQSLELLRRILKVDEDVPFSDQNRSELVKLFEDRSSKVAALFILLVVGLVDNLYDPGEQMLIEEIAISFGFVQEEVIKMGDIATRCRTALDELGAFKKIP